VSNKNNGSGGAPSVYVPQIRQVDVKMDGLDVVLVEKGSAILRLPWDAAIALGRAIITQGRRIEETVKANKIIQDQAFLIRKGIPIGLSSNPKILDEAVKEAQFNKELRKQIPAASIESTSIVGRPTIIQKEVKKDG